MLRTTVFAVLAGVATAIFDTSFNGTGQIRTLDHTSGNGTDIGCLTNAGQWTIVEDNCGVFTGDRNGAMAVYVSSEEGPCGRAQNGSELYFSCSGNQTAFNFWVFAGYSTRDILVYSEVFTWSSSSTFADADTDVLPLHSYQTSDPDPWLWLGWTAL
ncbi:hypothetical protein LQW54_005126 [Pestalotiopsis sp. IQ-011]